MEVLAIALLSCFILGKGTLYLIRMQISCGSLRMISILLAEINYNYFSNEK